MAPKKPMGNKRAKVPKVPKAPKAPKASPAPKSKPLPTGEVNQFPAHAFRADMGEGLPAQAPPPTGTDKAK